MSVTTSPDAARLAGAAAARRSLLPGTMFVGPLVEASRAGYLDAGWQEFSAGFTAELARLAEPHRQGLVIHGTPRLSGEV